MFFPSPLHIHSLGSRFISHIPSLPLCAVSLELPPPTSTAARFLQRTVPESQKRRVLLVGTADGLYAVEIRRESRGDDVVLNDSSARKGKENTRPQQEKGNWNGNVRCFQIWSGVGIYQMSVLAPQPSSGEGKLPLYGFGGRQSVAQESGIFLALCSSKTSSRQQITSTTPVTSLPDLANASSGVSPHSSSHGPRESSSTSLSTANFGREAGGGQGRHVPPSGSGGVRMWSLEAIRRIVTHVLDSAEHHPINLLRTTKTGQKGIHGFTSRFRKAWAIIGDERKFNRPLRHSEGTSMAGTSLSSMAPPMQISYSHEGRSKPSYVSPLQNGHSRSQSEQMLSTVTSWTDHDMMPEDNPGDFAHQEALRLSQQWVPIYLPGGGSQQSSLGHGSNNSHSSLAVDETLSGVRPGSLGSSTSMHSSGLHGKGILFYALTQANSDLHRSETWYLALVQSKSILLFESTSPSARGAARSWNFVKEFYTPMQPRGVSFCFSDSTDVDGNDHKSTTSTSTRRSSMRRSAMNMHKSVNFSSYSSVFRTNATLHLFVSLGKKAVIIRASDGYVREVDPQPPAQSWSTDSDAGHIGKHASASESSAPASKASSHGHSHSRWSLTMDMLDATNPKDAWTGLETVNAQVAIRCIPSGLMNEENQGDDDDDDDDEWDSDENAGTAHPGITLRDTSAGVPRSSLLRRPRKIQIPTHTVLAGVYILSHGFVSQILPSPLSRDTFHSRPLCSIQWPSVPTAVTATARVIGLERGLSSGPVSIDSLNRSRQQHGSLSDTSKTNEVILHLRIAVLAFLPSRIELRRVRVRVPVRLPFAYTRDTELELESAGASDLLSATAVVSQKDNDVRHGAGSEAHDDDASVHDELESDQSQELEYLCGMLCATSHEGKDTKPWEAAGDGGAWAFDWRGANVSQVFVIIFMADFCRISASSTQVPMCERRPALVKVLCHSRPCTLSTLICNSTVPGFPG